MKQSEARVKLLQQWDEWILTQAIDPGGPTGKDSLRFFYELEDDGSPSIRHHEDTELDAEADTALVSLLEENARLRALVVQLSDLVLRNVVGQK